MVGLLSTLQIVIALRVEGEVRAAVLKRDARAGDGDARAKAAVVALDKRDHVALCVRGAEVDRAAAVRVARFGLERLVCDECAAGGEIVGREQLADLRFHIARVGDVGLRVGKGKLDGLHDLVIVVRVLALFGQRQSVEHAECHQHRDAVAVGRDLADGVAAVVLRDGLDPFGVVVLEVVLAEVAARGARMGDDPFHQLAAVIALAVRLDEGAHRVGIGGETEDIARAVRRAVWLHKALPPVFMGSGVLRHDPGDAPAVARPELADIDGHGIAVFGVGNGGGEELGERLCAKARIERGPARGRARDHRGEPAFLGHLGKAFCTNLVRAQCHRRNAAGVQAVELFFLLDPHERETVGPKAVARRLEQRHRAGHGDGGIDGVAAIFQHVEADLCAEGDGRAAHAVFGVDHVAAGRISVS